MPRHRREEQHRQKERHLRKIERLEPLPIQCDVKRVVNDVDNDDRRGESNAHPWFDEKKQCRQGIDDRQRAPEHPAGPIRTIPIAVVPEKAVLKICPHVIGCRDQKTAGK